MRMRKIAKVGNSFCIRLAPVDLRDLKLKEGDFVDIEDIVKRNKGFKKNG